MTAASQLSPVIRIVDDDDRVRESVAFVLQRECQQFCVSLISLINRWLVKILGKSFTVHHSHFFHGCCPSW